MLRTSVRAEPGATKENAPPSSFSRGSFRTARRKPSTAAMVRKPPSISKSAPVWTGRLSLVDTAKATSSIMARRTRRWMDTA